MVLTADRLAVYIPDLEINGLRQHINGTKAAAE